MYTFRWNGISLHRELLSTQSISNNSSDIKYYMRDNVKRTFSSLELFLQFLDKTADEKSGVSKFDRIMQGHF